jgi:hypothetical protein
VGDAGQVVVVAVHAWHGTWVIDAPTVDRIADEGNVEVRWCAIERIGWGAFLDQAGLRIVGQVADPGNPGSELRLYDLPYRRWGAPTGRTACRPWHVAGAASAGVRCAASAVDQ